MNIDKKKFFADLDEDISKHAKKNDKKKMKKSKLDKDDPFGYGFDPDDFKKKKKKQKKDKDKKAKKHSSDDTFNDKKKEKTKKIKPYSDKLEVELGDSKFSKKILKQIKSKELQESFKKDKVLIDTKKFWTKD